MPLINPAVVEAARMVVRQATTSAVSIAISSTLAPTVASETSITGAPLPTTGSATQSSPLPTDTSTLANGNPNSGGGNNSGGNNNNNNNGGGGNSSSLLFFVALGFGVVFTNLWIIVGVKYCFRYNARNRQMRNEDGEPINMENMPRPHRRRREKKLMPIDEVNEKFPMLQYKMWVASRAQEGLPTRGGVSAPPSRANSVRDADGVVSEVAPKDRISTDGRPTTSAATTKAAPEPTPDATPEDAEKAEAQSPRHFPKESTSSTVGAIPRASTESHPEPESTVAHKHLSQMSHEDDDDDEHIDAALPPECLGTSGDTCAICIDTLEDDDYVRGLTCGHAFHASCIDPWLTTRRACCPLCKADYYTPKPRPQATEGGDGTTGVVQVNLPNNPRGNRMNMPNRPRPTFLGFTFLDRRHHSRRRTGTSPTRDNATSSVPGRRGSSTNPAPSSPDTTSTGSGGLLSSLRPFSRFRLGRGQNNQGQSEPVASGANATTTPSQLEGGFHNPGRI